MSRSDARRPGHAIDLRSGHPFVPVSADTRNHLINTRHTRRWRPPIQVCPKSVEDLRICMRREPYIATLSLGSLRRPVELLLTRDRSMPGEPCRTFFLQGDQIVTSRLIFDAELFEGDTVFLGEIVCSLTDASVLFVIEDLSVLQGQSMCASYERRNEIARDILARGHVPDPLFSVVRLSIKATCVPHVLAPLLTSRGALPYATTHVSLRPLIGSGPVFLVSLDENESQQDPPRPRPRPPPSPPPPPYFPLHRPDPSRLPRQPLDHEPSDPIRKTLRVCQTDLPDVYAVTDPTTGVGSIACIPTLSLSRTMRRLFGGAREVSVRCTYNVAFGKWEPSPQLASS